MCTDRQVVLVDFNNEVIGSCEKIEAHTAGLLHRAFSIFVIDAERNKMLIQKRAASKYHSGGLWSNACCSHPKHGVELPEVLPIRLKEELGIDIPFSKIIEEKPDSNSRKTLSPNVFYDCGSFRYFADFGAIKEHEIDRVFLVNIHSSETIIRRNPDEVEDTLWIAMDELKHWLTSSPEDFSAWFPLALPLVAWNGR